MMGYKRRAGRRSKGDVAIQLVKSELGQQLLSLQAAEIEKHIAELEYQARALRVDLDALNRLRHNSGANGESTKSRTATPRKAPQRRRNGRGRSRRSPDPETVLATIAEAMKENRNGITIGQLGKRLDQPTQRIRPVLLRLIADKRLGKSGSRRATRYRVS